MDGHALIFDLVNENRVSPSYPIFGFSREIHGLRCVNVVGLVNDNGCLKCPIVKPKQQNILCLTEKKNQHCVYNFKNIHKGGNYAFRCLHNFKYLIHNRQSRLKEENNPRVLTGSGFIVILRTGDFSDMKQYLT